MRNAGRFDAWSDERIQTLRVAGQCAERLAGAHVLVDGRRGEFERRGAPASSCVMSTAASTAACDIASPSSAARQRVAAQRTRRRLLGRLPARLLGRLLRRCCDVCGDVCGDECGDKPKQCRCCSRRARQRREPREQQTQRVGLPARASRSRGGCSGVTAGRADDFLDHR